MPGPRQHDVAPFSDTRASRDRGVSFIEIVVTIALMGLIVIPILSAVTTLTKASNTSRQAANVETALINAVDRINRAPSDECDYGRYAEAAVLTQGWSAGQASVDHAYLDGGNWVSGPAGAEACPTAGDRPLLVKLVRVSVTSPDGKVTRSVEVVKSDV